MKKVTGISFVHAPEGLRVAYSYSELDDDVNVISSNNRSSYINGDDAVAKFVSDMEASILQRIEK